MSILNRLPWNQAAIATEAGWVSLEGKLLVQSNNLLTQRVLKGLADAEELTRWANLKLAEIKDRRDRVTSAYETNSLRKKDIENRFKTENAELLKQSEFDIGAKISYLSKEIEHLKVIAEYEKAFTASKEELTRLQEKEDKVRSRLNVLSTIVTEKKPEQAQVEPEKKQTEQAAKPKEQVLSRAQKGAATRRRNREAAKAKEAQSKELTEKKLQYPGEEEPKLPEA